MICCRFPSISLVHSERRTCALSSICKCRPVSSFAFCCCGKHHSQMQFTEKKKKVYFSSQAVYSIIEGKSGQEPEGRNISWGQGGVLPTGLLPVACSVCLCNWSPPLGCGSLLTTCQSRKCPTDKPTGQSNGGDSWRSPLFRWLLFVSG